MRKKWENVVGDKKRSAYVIYECSLRKTTRIRTPKRFYDDPDAPKTPEDKKDMDFKIETKTAKIKTPKSKIVNSDSEVQLPSTPKMKGTPKMGTPKVATPKMGTPTRSSRSSRNCTPKQQGFYDDHADTLAPKTPEADEDFKVEKYLKSASSSTSKNKKTAINNITPQKTPKSVSKRSSKKNENGLGSPQER